MIALVRRPAGPAAVDGAHRIEHRDLHARVAQALEQGIRRLDGAHGIHHQRHVGAAVARRDQGFGEARALRVVVEDIRLHVHVMSRLRDRAQHGLVSAGAIG